MFPTSKNLPWRLLIPVIALIVLVGPNRYASGQDDPSKSTPFSSYTPISDENPPPPFQKIRTRFRNVSVFRASFSEKRIVEDLTKPIQTSGYVVFARKLGVFRHIETPFTSDQFFSDDGVVIEETRDGIQRKKLQPGSPERAFMDALFQMFSGHFTDFARRFNLFFKEKENDAWSIGMTPATSRLKEFLKRIRIEGSGKTLRALHVYQANGDVFRTTFEGYRFLDKLPSSAEKRIRKLRESGE